MVTKLLIRNTASLLLLAFLCVPSYSQITPLEQLGSYAPKTDIELPLPAGYEKIRVSDVKTAGLSGEQLFQYVYENSEITKPHGYDEAKKYMFSAVDNAPCPNGVKGVVGFYSRICVNGASGNGSDYKEKGDMNGDGFVDSDGMNTEHLWPQSLFNEQAPMKSDLHHLRPTFMKPNNMRGSLPFVEVSGQPSYSTSSGAKLGPGGFEPPDEVKGDVARAMLYFFVRYHDRQIRFTSQEYKDFIISQIDTLMKWNLSDPPDEAEMRRNTAIERYQGNRNLFVDDYTLADRIGAKVFKSH